MATAAPPPSAYSQRGLKPKAADLRQACEAWPLRCHLGLGLVFSQLRSAKRAKNDDYSELLELVREHLNDNNDYSKD
jgi:hypothetical protein